MEEGTRLKSRLIPILHQERHSILFYTLIFFWYGFFIDFKPSEPFLVPYLIKDKGFTNDQIEQDIFPLWTYAYFVAVVLCGLLSEVVQYKPLLVVGSFARLATRLILIFGTSMIMMQSTQLTFGLASGTEVLFYSYIYYLVPYSQYQRLTGITRASVLVGHVGANLLGQLLVTKFHSPLLLLFYISLVAIGIATIISFFFPSVTIELKSCSQNYEGMKSAFLDILANKETLQWAIWYMLAMSCNDMILNYATTLFFDADPNIDYNGLVMAIVRLSGAVGAIIPALHIIDKNIERYRKPTVVILTVIGSVAIGICSIANIWVIYACCVVYMATITFGISVASAQIAKSMSTRKYALVFSVITIVYLGIESLFQFVIGGTVLSLGSRVMFAAFGVTLFLASILFAIAAFVLRERREYSHISQVDESASIN